MTGWQNDFVTKWPVENDKCQHDKMTVTKWKIDNMIKWLCNKMTNSQHDKITVTKWLVQNYTNDNMTKCPVEKWQNWRTFWWNDHWQNDYKTKLPVNKMALKIWQIIIMTG